MPKFIVQLLLVEFALAGLIYAAETPEECAAALVKQMVERGAARRGTLWAGDGVSAGDGTRGGESGEGRNGPYLRNGIRTWWTP